MRWAAQPGLSLPTCSRFSTSRRQRSNAPRPARNGSRILQLEPRLFAEASQMALWVRRFVVRRTCAYPNAGMAAGVTVARCRNVRQFCGTLHMGLPSAADRLLRHLRRRLRAISFTFAQWSDSVGTRRTPADKHDGRVALLLAKGRGPGPPAL